MQFRSKILIHPGLGNSGEQHWQTLWERRFPDFHRINHKEWDTPDQKEWITMIDHYVMQHDPKEVILVGHSLACCAIAYWYKEYKRVIKGALLVAPSDTEAESYPSGTTGFTPMPLVKFPFPTITVMSTNDFYVRIERARTFAKAWGSELFNIGDAGHINAESKLGLWEFGLELLKRLDTD
jgi:predicted alpha/beta hydrolase family esterase